MKYSTSGYSRVKGNLVAPYTGAWIEISAESTLRVQAGVAPYTGAWIEIANSGFYFYPTAGRTLHGCVD